MRLERRIEESAGKPINVTRWFNYYTIDIMSDMAFGNSLNMLRSGESHFAIEILRQGMAMLGPLSPVPWLFIIFSKVPGLSRDWKRMLRWARKQVKHRIEVRSWSCTTCDFIADFCN
jgi:hypothetical protein